MVNEQEAKESLEGACVHPRTDQALTAPWGECSSPGLPRWGSQGMERPRSPWGQHFSLSSLLLFIGLLPRDVYNLSLGSHRP